MCVTPEPTCSCGEPWDDLAHHRQPPMACFYVAVIKDGTDTEIRDRPTPLTGPKGQK